MFSNIQSTNIHLHENKEEHDKSILMTDNMEVSVTMRISNNKDSRYLNMFQFPITNLGFKSVQGRHREFEI